jgi:hypothetical protein
VDPGKLKVKARYMAVITFPASEESQMYRIENERFSFMLAIARDMFLSPFTISLYQMRFICHM